MKRSPGVAMILAKDTDHARYGSRWCFQLGDQFRRTSPENKAMPTTAKVWLAVSNTKSIDNRKWIVVKQKPQRENSENATPGPGFIPLAPVCNRNSTVEDNGFAL